MAQDITEGGGGAGGGNICAFNARSTQAERTENARRAGVASGAARRQRSLLRDSISAGLEAKVRSPDVRKRLKAAGLGNTVQDKIVLELLEMAADGDLAAMRFIRDTLGEAPERKVAQYVEQKTELAVGLKSLEEELRNMTDEELEAILAGADGGPEAVLAGTDGELEAILAGTEDG